MLAAIQRQTKPADHLVIVDNGSDANVRAVADNIGADYIDPGDNFGTRAGGVATSDGACARPGIRRGLATTAGR